ncbi:MAG: hypothetical protein WCK53_13290, partial [Methanomicrobiales archaeon]
HVGLLLEIIGKKENFQSIFIFIPCSIFIFLKNGPPGIPNSNVAAAPPFGHPMWVWDQGRKYLIFSLPGSARPLSLNHARELLQ